MPRKRPPDEDKQLDYAKQRRGFSEYPKALRHGKWRKNKRRPAQQQVRQAEQRAVKTASPTALRDAGFDEGALARPKISKWPPASLGQWVEGQKSQREDRIGGKKRRRDQRRR